MVKTKVVDKAIRFGHGFFMMRAKNLFP